MGFRFSVRNGLYVGGAVVLLMAMALLTAIHVYTAINPPTIVLAIQPGGNKPQMSAWYSCGWSWSSSYVPFGGTVSFDGYCTYYLDVSDTSYQFAVYIYDPYWWANPPPSGTYYLPGCGSGTLNMGVVYVNGQPAWYEAWSCEYTPPYYIGLSFTASAIGHWTPNMPNTYTGCASALNTPGYNDGSPKCSSYTYG
jgi:hypothetical protein